MPTYLTPGVYVEEVPSTSKPITGVATSVAAFVGLAPGGPVNTPMRISNWTQFVRLFSDPSNPDAGPFIEGSYLAHSIYGYFANGGGVAWVIRVGADEDQTAGTTAARAILPSAADGQLEAFRVVARERNAGGITVEVIDATEPPKEDGGEVTPTFRVVVSRGEEREEHDGLTLRRGRSHIAT